MKTIFPSFLFHLFFSILFNVPSSPDKLFHIYWRHSRLLITGEEWSSAHSTLIVPPRVFLKTAKGLVNSQRQFSLATSAILFNFGQLLARVTLWFQTVEIFNVKSLTQSKITHSTPHSVYLVYYKQIEALNLRPKIILGLSCYTCADYLCIRRLNFAIKRVYCSWSVDFRALAVIAVHSENGLVRIKLLYTSFL